MADDIFKENEKNHVGQDDQYIAPGTSIGPLPSTINSAYRQAVRTFKQGCTGSGGFWQGSGENLICLSGEAAVAAAAAVGENAPAYDRAQDWLADYYEGTDAGTGPDVEETTEVVETGTDPQQQIDDFQAEIDELFTPGKFTVEGIENGEPIVVIQNEDGTSTTIVGIEELQEYEEEAAAAAEEAAAAEAAAAEAAEEAAEEVSSAISDAVSEGDFETAEQIAKDYNKEYGEINPDIVGEANKDVGGFEEAYKDRETQAEQAAKEEEKEQEQDNSDIDVDWADYEIVGQREDGCYDVRQKSTGTVFVACPGDVVNGVAVDSGTNDEEVEDNGEDELTFGGASTKNATEETVEEVVEDIFTSTTDEGEDDFTFGGSTTKDTTEDTEPEQKDKESSETEQKDKDAEETEQKDKDAAETAKDIAEQLLKDSTSNDTEGGLTFGGAATKDDGGGGEVEEEPGDDEGETELEIALDPTKDGGVDVGEDPGDVGFTFGGGSDTKDTGGGGDKDGTGSSDTEGPEGPEGPGKDGTGSSDTEGPGEEPGDEGLTFGGGSVVKDTKDETGSSDTEGKDGTGDSDTEGPGDKDGTGSSDTEGPGEEEAESLFGLTKDAGSVGGSKSPLGFNPFMAGISYESPTIQNIVQSPNVDYMAQLNKIINKGMLV